MFDPNRKADVLMTVETSPLPAKRVAANPPSVIPPNGVEQNRFFGYSEPRGELDCLLSVLGVPRWFAGLWQEDVLHGSVFSEVPGGWFNNRSGLPVFVSFETAREWIDERIVELGLDADLVRAWPKSDHGLELPFESRMDFFRVRK
jgi:hypothetical protein